jgi:hypothetical protein
MLNPVTASKIDYLVNQRKNSYAHIRDLREYASGEHTAILTDDEKIKLVGTDDAGNPAREVEFNLNVCKTCIDVEVDRLQVRDIAITAPLVQEGEDSEPGATDEQVSKELSAIANQRWKSNRLDEGQRGAHQPAVRDGDSFAIVWFDKEQGESRVALHKAYDGQESGVDMFYVDNDPLQPLYAVKVWIAKDTNSVKVRRKNVYFADRIEKWISEGYVAGSVFADADWRPLRFGDDDWTKELAEVPAMHSSSRELATVEWWTETGTAPQYNEQGVFTGGGMPLGLPVFHFRHESEGEAYGVSTIEPLVPGLQDAINDAALSVLVAQKLAGYKVNWATGFDPQTSTYTTYPGATVYNPEPDGDFGQFAETDLRQLVEVKDTFVKDAATLTATPLTYFNLSGVIPAEGTQQTLESALLAKTRRNHVSFGNAWEDIFRYMFKLEKVWGTTLVAYSVELLQSVNIDTVWESAQMRNELNEAEIAKIHKELGVPDRWVWKKLGYSEDEIDQFQTMREVRRNETIGALAERIAVTEAANNGAQQTANQSIA